MNQKEKRAGLIAGISIIIMAMAAGFSYGYVQNKFIDIPVEMLRQNVLENKYLFFAGIAGWIVIFITDLIVAAKLYLFFKQGMAHLSRLTAVIRIIYTLILGTTIYQLIAIIPLLQAPDTSFDINAQFILFNKIWSAALIIFGFHLLALGYLSKRSGHIPGLLSYLLYLAGFSYVLIHSGKTFALLQPHLINSAETILALPMALSEIILAFWFLYIAWKPGTLSKIRKSSVIRTF